MTATSTRRRFDDAQEDRLLWRYQRGATQTELASEYGVTRRTVWRAIQRARARES